MGVGTFVMTESDIFLFSLCISEGFFQTFCPFRTIMASPGLISLFCNFAQFLNVCPFDYTAVAVSGKVERLNF